MPRKRSERERSGWRRTCAVGRRLAACLLVALSACAGCTTIRRYVPAIPPIPVGKPADRTLELLALQETWDRSRPGVVIVPAEDLQLLWDDRADWWAFGRALEAMLRTLARGLGSDAPAGPAPADPELAQPDEEQSPLLPEGGNSSPLVVPERGPPLEWRTW